MVTMEIFDSRESWLKGRSGRIGGSEAACVVGMNPYLSNVELWEIKTGRRTRKDISDSPFVKYGHDAEPHLRELFTLDFPQYKVGYVDNNMWFNDKYPFSHASLDGYLEDKVGRKGILEIKTTNILQSMQYEKWDGRIPNQYYVQCLHYLMVTEFDFAILKAQLRYDYGEEVKMVTKHYKMERSEVAEDIEYLKNAEKKFFEYVKADKEPPLILPEI